MLLQTFLKHCTKSGTFLRREMALSVGHDLHVLEEDEVDGRAKTTGAVSLHFVSEFRR
jgi:hypothetical protein